MNFDFSGLKQGLAKMDLGKDQAGMVYNVPIDNIRPNPDQPRKDFDDEGLLRLAEDMKRNGLIQPVVIRADKENPEKFILVTGERRYRAAKLNGDKTIKAILDESWKDEEIGYVQMAENLQRADLKFWELADFIIRHADAGEKQSDIAKKLGFGKSRVSQYMKWKEIPDYIKAKKDKLKAIDTAFELLKLPEEEAKKLLDETPEGEFVSRVQVQKLLDDKKPVETAPVSESGSSSATEAAPEAPSASDSGAEGPTEESFASSKDTGTGDESGSDAGDSAGDSFSFNEGSSGDSSSGTSESSGDSTFSESESDSSSGSFEESGSSETSESFTESSGSETGSFSGESETGSAESTADSGSDGESFSFNEGSSDDSGSESSESSGETEVSGSGDSSSLAFDLSEPAADEFKKPIIYGSVDGREAELLWKRKPQTDGWVVVKYEDGTTEEILAERYRLNRIYEIN